jgi:LuxR family transcriptional regulator, maltose regulon positive regulatory protein
VRQVPGAWPSGLPLPLPDEVVRPRLLDHIDARWQHPVTVVVADAGFGKSTLLSQAVRANALEPRGIDVWHSCTPGDVDADVLGGSLLTALGAEVRRPELIAHLVDALARYSPIDVCVVLDDAHEIVPESSGAELIIGLIRQLPENAHLVLAARHGVPGALSRLRAADRLVEISQDDLMFDSNETTQLAARLGRDPKVASGLGGWPALVRLALAAKPGVAMKFAQEEVLSRLSGEQRRTLFALSNLGYADHDRVRHVVGFDIDLTHLASTIPFVTRTENGLFRAHDLWSEALTNVIDAAQIVELRGRIVHELIGDGQLARAGAIALAHRDLDALAKVALETVSRTIAALPIDTVRPWADVLKRGRPDDPETLLLLAAIGQALDFTDASIDAALDAAAAAFCASGRPASGAVAIAVATLAAYSRSDIGRLVALAEVAARIPDAQDHPVINLAVHSIAAVVAEMSGDLEKALYELRAAQIDRVPAAVGIIATRLLIHNLLLSGRADEAAEVARKLLTKTNDKMANYLSAISLWMAGEPADLLALGRPVVDVPALSSRDWFVRRTIVAALLASTGRRDEVHRLVNSHDLVGRPEGRPADTRDAVLDAVAHAFSAIVDHDETQAELLIADVLAAHQGSPILEQHLRRFLAIVYVLHPEQRAIWDNASLGPTHGKARATSRLLLDLRAGHRVTSCDVNPPHIFTSLPLPWSIELACRLIANKHPAGAALGDWLVGQVPEPARTELRYLAERIDDRGEGLPRVSRAANDLLSHLPAVPSRHLDIAVLGPLQIAHDGTPVESSELRRARVRTLLALLVVHGTVSRGSVTDLLWPDLSSRDGARNLRVTLTYLRQLLEPGRPTGEASYHLRADTATISLHQSEHLTVDLWELRRLIGDAAASRDKGDQDRTITLLSAATSWWRAEPLTDLGLVAGEEHETERVRLAHLGALLELGELRLARGQMANALLDAEQALALDPYSERAHRLALAAALHGHDHERTGIVAERVVAMLKELGVEPEPATRILLRQAG